MNSNAAPTIKYSLLSPFGQFVQGYYDCMLWSETDFDGEPLEDRISEHDVAHEAQLQIVNDCENFMKQASHLLAEKPDTYDYSRAGHDFWLTRNGHGAGFWDRPELNRGSDLGEDLTAIAKTFTELSPYIGDDGLLYL